MHAYWPDEIDHKNGKPSDNRIENLRDVTTKANNQNQSKPQKHNKSGFLGVSWSGSRGRWRAQIAVDGKSRDIGYFEDPAEAHQAYVLEKRRVHATCTI